MPATGRRWPSANSDSAKRSPCNPGTTGLETVGHYQRGSLTRFVLLVLTRQPQRRITAGGARIEVAVADYELCGHIMRQITRGLSRGLLRRHWELTKWARRCLQCRGCSGISIRRLPNPCGWAVWLPILGPVIGDGFAAVLAAAQEGSEAAFSRLWRDGNPALLRYLRVVAPDVAEDVAADTWLHVVRGLARFRGDEHAWRAWLFTTARRRAIDEGRRRSRRPVSPLGETRPDWLPASPDTADVAIEHLATRSALALVAGLPSLQAEVILLRVVAGLDTDTVARLTGRSPGAVRVAVHRGLRRLAQVVAEAGVTL